MENVVPADNGQLNEEKQKHIDAFVNPTLVMLCYMVKKTHTTVDEQTIKQLKKALDKLDLTKEYTDAEFAEAIFAIIHEATDMSANKWDDKLYTYAKMLWNMFNGGAPFITWIAKLKAKAEERKEQRRAAKVSAEEAKKK